MAPCRHARLPLVVGFRRREMGEQPTVVPGERRIEWRPTVEPEKRWEGTIDHDEYRERVWQEGTIEEVIAHMDYDLGTVPDDQYVVREG